MALRHILPLMFLAAPVSAADLADAGAIRAALAGNTVVGNMLASGSFAEFYAPDGAIHAADYTGNWAVKGNKMCFAYGGEAETCFGVAISGSQVVWMGDGGEEGSGSIKSGNPNGW